VIEMVPGQMPDLDERRPGDGSGVNRRHQPDGVAPDPHGLERVQSPEGRAVADGDPGEKSMQSVAVQGGGAGVRGDQCPCHVSLRCVSTNVDAPPRAGAANGCQRTREWSE
jgi:hypothetical protein